MSYPGVTTLSDLRPPKIETNASVNDQSGITGINVQNGMLRLTGRTGLKYVYNGYYSKPSLLTSLTQAED